MRFHPAPLFAATLFLSAAPLPGQNISVEALRVASERWDRAFRDCGDSRYTFAFRNLGDPDVAEIKGFTHSLRSDTLSEADRLNGVEWRGRSIAKWKLERHFNENLPLQRWSKWKDWVDAPTTFTRDFYSFYLVKEGGQWKLTYDRWNPFDLSPDARDCADMIARTGPAAIARGRAEAAARQQQRAREDSEAVAYNRRIRAVWEKKDSVKVDTAKEKPVPAPPSPEGGTGANTAAINLLKGSWAGTVGSYQATLVVTDEGGRGVATVVIDGRSAGVVEETMNVESGPSTKVTLRGVSYRLLKKPSGLTGFIGRATGAQYALDVFEGEISEKGRLLVGTSKDAGRQVTQWSFKRDSARPIVTGGSTGATTPSGTASSPVRPVTGAVTLGFGVQVSWADSPHNGIDYRNPLGGEVQAAGEGVLQSYTKPNASRFGSIGPDRPGPAIWLKVALSSGEPVYILYGHTADSWSDDQGGACAIIARTCTYRVKPAGSSISSGVIGLTAPFFNGGTSQPHVHVSVFKPARKSDGTYHEPPASGWGYSDTKLVTGEYLDPEDFFKNYRIAAGRAR